MVIKLKSKEGSGDPSAPTASGKCSASALGKCRGKSGKRPGQRKQADCRGALRRHHTARGLMIKMPVAHVDRLIQQVLLNTASRGTCCDLCQERYHPGHWQRRVRPAARGGGAEWASLTGASLVWHVRVSLTSADARPATIEPPATLPLNFFFLRPNSSYSSSPPSSSTLRELCRACASRKPPAAPVRCSVGSRPGFFLLLQQGERRGVSGCTT